MRISATRKVLRPCSVFSSNSSDAGNINGGSGATEDHAYESDSVEPGGANVNQDMHSLPAQHLVELGSACAQRGEYSGALNYWYRGSCGIRFLYHSALYAEYVALATDPNNAVIHELRAQVFLELDEPLKACLSAETAVRLAPDWYVGHQTLARYTRTYLTYLYG
jgi:hypothetical protein